MKIKIALTLILSISIFFFSCTNSSNQNNETPAVDKIEEIKEPSEETAAEPIAELNDTIALPDGLYCIIKVQGTGPKPVNGKKVTVHYSGYLVDGTKFDSSLDVGRPLEFKIGMGEVIKGWDRGIAVLNTGSKARLIIPHELAYGVDGYPNVIPPKATLIFDVELLNAEQ